MNQEIDSCLNFKTLHFEGGLAPATFYAAFTTKTHTQKSRVYIYIWIQCCRIRANNMGIMTKKRQN